MKSFELILTVVLGCMLHGYGNDIKGCGYVDCEAKICLKEKFNDNKMCLTINGNSVNFTQKQVATIWRMEEQDSGAYSIFNGTVCLAEVITDGNFMLGTTPCSPEQITWNFQEADSENTYQILSGGESAGCLTTMATEDFERIAKTPTDLGKDSLIGIKNCFTNDAYDDRKSAQTFHFKDEIIFTKTPTSPPSLPPSEIEPYGILCTKSKQNLCLGLSLHEPHPFESQRLQIKPYSDNVEKNLTHLKLEWHAEKQAHRLRTFIDESLCISAKSDLGDEEGDVILLKTCDGSDEENWSIDSSNGFDQLRHGSTGKCATVMRCDGGKNGHCSSESDEAAGSKDQIKAGAFVRLRDCQNDVSQEFIWFNEMNGGTEKPTPITAYPTTINKQSEPSMSPTVAKMTETSSPSTQSTTVDQTSSISPGALLLILILVLVVGVSIFAYFKFKNNKFSSLNDGDSEFTQNLGSSGEFVDIPFDSRNVEVVKLS